MHLSLVFDPSKSHIRPNFLMVFCFFVPFDFYIESRLQGLKLALNYGCSGSNLCRFSRSKAKELLDSPFFLTSHKDIIFISPMSETIFTAELYQAIDLETDLSEDREYQEFKRASSQGNLVPMFERLFSDHLTPVLAYRCLVDEQDKESPSFLFESVTNGDQTVRHSFSYQFLAHSFTIEYYRNDSFCFLVKSRFKFIFGPSNAQRLPLQ